MDKITFWVKLLLHNTIHDPKARRGFIIAFLAQGVAMIAFPWIGWWGQLFAGMFMTEAVRSAIGDNDDDDDDFGGGDDSEYKLEAKPGDLTPGLIA